MEPLVDRISDYLVQMDIDPEPTEEGIFLVRYGSAVVMISTFTHDGQEYVRLAAVLLLGFRPKLELLTRLLRLNSHVLMGSFQLFEDETLCFTHTLLAKGLDLATFRHALLYVGRVADDHDEALQALGGGERMEELLDAPA